MKGNLYRGERTKKGCKVTVNGFPLYYNPRDECDPLSVFDWGNGLAAPSRLAFAILANEYGEEVAYECFSRFKWDIVAKLPACWDLCNHVLDAWLESYRAKGHARAEAVNATIP